MTQPSFDVIVIGEGVSGLTVARLLAQDGVSVATMEAGLFGGLVANINHLWPPPESGPMSGPEVAADLMEANSDLGVKSINMAVSAIGIEGELRVVAEGQSFSARQIIVATGARLRRLGIPGEEKFEGRGVSQCADCDGPLFQGEEVVVVGGGDSALQEALALAEFCKVVHVVHRRDAFRARLELAEAVAAQPRITPIWNAEVESIRGSKNVEAVRLRHGGGRTHELKCAGVFAYIGLTPNTDFLPQAIQRGAAGHVTTSESLETAVPNVWAIGAVREGFAGKLADALGDASTVARAVRERRA